MEMIDVPDSRAESAISVLDRSWQSHIGEIVMFNDNAVLLVSNVMNSKA